MDSKMESGSKADNKNNDVGVGIGLAVFIIGLWLASWYYIDKHIQADPVGSNIAAVRGAFGDKFGAINALFSGLAFAGIIFTILLQRRDLSLQRQELEETRKEFIQQNETLKKQRFENTFFQLLSLHTEIVGKLKIRVVADQEIYENREFFVGAIKELKYSSVYQYFKYSALNKLNPSEIS